MLVIEVVTDIFAELKGGYYDIGSSSFYLKLITNFLGLFTDELLVILLSMYFCYFF